uniref:BTB domain-containing protein n=1 Tax=Panagrolaimus davidi TaxID=227884 RepID=A0A914PE91_9BILA
MNSIETKIANECQIRMKWRIKEEVLKEALNNAADDDTNMESKYFKASKIFGVEYYLSIKFDGDDPNEINLFLQLEFEMAKKIDATFKLSVKTASYEENSEYVYEESNGFGNTLCTRDEIFDAEKKFFVNGIMEIELEGTLKAIGIKRKAPESSSLGDVLWENDDDKDLTIAVKNQELKAHKWILCAKSPVFKAEMESGMKEARENRIEIPGFSFETVKIVVEYCYERDIKELITEENASELLHFSDKYDMKFLHHDVQFSLIDKISESNVVKFANASVTFNAKELREYCVCFLMKFVGKSTFIKCAENLREEITSEIGRRSLFSIVE